MRSVVVVLSVLFAAMGMPSLAAAQPWPSKPVRIIVGFPPGGAVDILARTLGRAMATELGQSVVIETKAGAAQPLEVRRLRGRGRIDTRTAALTPGRLRSRRLLRGL